MGGRCGAYKIKVGGKVSVCTCVCVELMLPAVLVIVTVNSLVYLYYAAGMEE